MIVALGHTCTMIGAFENYCIAFHGFIHYCVLNFQGLCSFVAQYHQILKYCDKCCTRTLSVKKRVLYYLVLNLYVILVFAKQVDSTFRAF